MQLRHNEQIIWTGRSSWRALYPFWLRYVALSLIPLILVGLLGIFTSTEIGFLPELMSLTLLALVLIGIATGIKRFYTVYTITDSRLNIERGILSKKSQNCRIERIQNADCDQSLLERILRVGSVEFITAGTEEANFSFDSVSDPHGLIAQIDELQEGEMTSPPYKG